VDDYYEDMSAMCGGRLKGGLQFPLLCVVAVDDPVRTSVCVYVSVCVVRERERESL
jgi:hypothetical protein